MVADDRLVVVSDIVLVKGATAADDRTWMALADGSTRRVAVHAVHDLPHLVVESLFGLDDGLWAVLAGGGFAAANRSVTARDARRRARLVTDAALDDLAAEHWVGHLVAKAATNAVMNRGGDGPDTPDGVRDRLRASARGSQASRPRGDSAALQRRLRELASSLDDETIDLAIVGVRRLSITWTHLEPGGTLRLRWPLSPTWATDGRTQD